MSAFRLRVVMIAFFVAALVFTAVAGEEERGPVFAAGVACFFVGVALFFRWRRALYFEARDGKVLDREEKTAEGGNE